MVKKYQKRHLNREYTHYSTKKLMTGVLIVLVVEVVVMAVNKHHWHGDKGDNKIQF
jgi:hypothetical protein